MEKAHSIYQTSTMPIVSQAGQTVSSTPQLPRPVPTVPASEVAALCNPTSARSVTPLSPNVLLFNDTSVHYHWGCTGTSWALKECINRLGFELQTVPIATTYSLLAVPPFEEFDGLEQFHSFQEANETILRQMQSADLIVITGEGTIHDLGDGPRALLYLAYISKKFLSKHVEIINHSAYPKDGPLSPTLNTFLKTQEQDEPGLLRAQEIYKSVYGKLDFVAIRESFSREVMSRLGVSSTLSFDCLPLYIRDHYHNPKDVQRKTVVLAGAPDFSESQGEQLCGYLERLYHEGYEVKVLTGAAADPSRHDAAFAQFLKEHAKVPLNMVDASSMEEWLDTINNATLLVSNRSHPLLSINDPKRGVLGSGSRMPKSDD